MSGGYEATMQLAAERPDLIPLLRKCLEAATVDDVFALSLDFGNAKGLAELERRGLIEKVYFATQPQPRPVNRPWECPRCGTVHAWWAERCDAVPPALSERCLVKRRHSGLRGFDVHHKNGDTQDNRLENLELLSHEEHASFHALAAHRPGEPYGDDPESGEIPLHYPGKSSRRL